jgi:molybdopterin converting factor small subunit
MSKEIKTIRIKLFGCFKEYGDSESEIVVPAAPTPDALKELLISYFQVQYPGADLAERVKEAAIADEEMVLSSESSLEGRDWIALLPPVCGG